jgi:ribonucleoside-diphosphate reductase alpha chain
MRDWIRRFKNFANNYFDGDNKMAEYCLKDVHLLHKWVKIQANLVPVDWENELIEQRSIDIDTLGAQACVGGFCETDL